MSAVLRPPDLITYWDTNVWYMDYTGRTSKQSVNNTLADGDKWTCSKCGKTFTSVSEVQMHVIQCEEIKCEFCNKTFTLKQNLKCHIEKKHSAYICEKCKKRFENGWLLREHIVDKICDK